MDTSIERPVASPSDAACSAASDTAGRRNFLGRLGVGAVIAAAGALPLLPEDTLAYTGTKSVPVDRVKAPWSDAWLDKITGKHKQFFDGVTYNDGFVLAFAANFLNLNHEAYGLSDKDLTAVVGLRHFCMPMALPDAMWAKYKVGETFKVTDPATKAPAIRNPFMHPDGVRLPGSDIPTLVNRGVVFTVCNVALTVFSGMTAANAGVTAEQAKQEWTEQLLPGMNLVPVGVLAVNRAQERGCTYCYGG
jgi:intracellular sulfur oxidation DsrE/DsrF family protein